MDTKISHFPGPYRVRGKSIKAITHGQEFTIARADCAKFTPEGNEATARLLAAAPDLYDALEELVLRCDGAEGVRSDGSNIQTMQAHAILAKVRP